MSRFYKKVSNAPESFELIPGKDFDFPFGLQRFAEGDGIGDGTGTGEGDGAVDGTGNGNGTGDAKKAKPEFVEKLDPITKKLVKIPKEVDSLIGHYISSTRENAKKDYEPLLEKINTLESENKEFTAVKEELEKLRFENMTADERAQENVKKVVRESNNAVKTASEERDYFKNLFERQTIKNDIYSSFGNVKLCNTEQVMVLFESEGKARVEKIIGDDGKPTGEYETRVTLMLEDKDKYVEKVEGNPKELFKRWIALERNAHHIQNDIAIGSGAMKSKTIMKDGKKVDLMGLSPVERLNAVREHKG
jgi:hypothetical protein